jgi:hypothetical protein
VRRFAFLLVLLLAGFGASSAAAKPHLAKADRDAINATLDSFVTHAVVRHDVAKSFDLVTPYLRGGTDRKHWTANSIPVYPYPAAGKHFHHWKLDYIDSTVGIELLLYPRKGANTGPVIFNVDLKRVHGRWLVDAFTPAASFAPVGKKAGVTAIADFGAKAAGGSDAAGGKARFNAAIAYIPFAGVGILLAALAAWGISRRVRTRRAYAALGPAKKLPPLPRR